jgi:hypothetical protein
VVRRGDLGGPIRATDRQVLDHLAGEIDARKA